MFKKDWWRNKTESKELCIGWLYNNNIKTDYLQHYSKATLDFWSIELSFFCNKQYAEEKIVDLFEKAVSNGFKKIVVFKQGIILNDFEEQFPTFYEENPDAKFIGHILDKEDDYYSIHQQCFLIDLEWWESAGKPEWGNDEDDVEPYQLPEPIRSENNHHDGYTPHWVGPGSNLRTYTGKQTGWNIVEHLLRDNHKIISWNEDVRLSKGYTYGEVKQDGFRNIHETLTINNPNVFFIANTENGRHVVPPKDTPVKKFTKVVAPASGISPIFFAFDKKLTAGDTLWIYDVSRYALGCMQQIIEEWDGTNFKQFANNFMDSRVGKWDGTEFKQYDSKFEYFKGIKQIEYTEKHLSEIYEEGFLEWYRTVFPKLNVNYYHQNLLNTHKHDKFAAKCRPNLKGSTYVHLSNIFHYEVTAKWYTLEERYKIHRELLHAINKYNYNNDNDILVYSTCPAREAGGYNWIQLHIDRMPEWDKIAPWNIGKLFKWNKTKKK